MFDYDKDNKITSNEVGAVVRSVGLNPTEAELKEMVAEVNSSKKFFFKLHECSILHRQYSLRKSGHFSCVKITYEFFFQIILSYFSVIL